ncbi:MAG: thioesterase family protein [Cyclobacteriaceae bacterium]|jgi:acyl-CoA thioester hydrolase|nr:thioesterase family protein [Cyclobacteriaceae bacterium]
MARVAIQLPDLFIYETDMVVRVSDLNYGNHVGNDSILTLMQEARTLFYRNRGFESEVKLEGSIGQIVADAAIVYKSESFLGDTLRIQIAVGEHHKYGFDLFYRITQRKTGKEVALGKTGIVCFDYDKRKMISIPASVFAKLFMK